MFTKAEKIKKENEKFRKEQSKTALAVFEKQKDLIEAEIHQMKLEHRDTGIVEGIVKEELCQEIKDGLKESGWYYGFSRVDGILKLHLSVTNQF